MKMIYGQVGKWTVFARYYARRTRQEDLILDYVSEALNLEKIKTLSKVRSSLIDMLSKAGGCNTVEMLIVPGARYVGGVIAAHKLVLRRINSKRIIASVRTPIYSSEEANSYKRGRSNKHLA